MSRLPMRIPAYRQFSIEHIVRTAGGDIRQHSKQWLGRKPVYRKPDLPSTEMEVIHLTRKEVFDETRFYSD